MTTVVKTQTAQDFLALVPHLVGFPPEESIVCVAFRGKRTCAALRFGLPADGSERFHRRIATTIVGMLSKLPGADAVVPVVYTGRPLESDDGVAYAHFVAALIERFGFSGFEVRDALCVAGDGWAPYPESGDAPVVRPLADIDDSTIRARIPVAERRELGDLDAWSSLPVADLAQRERLARHLALLERFRDEVSDVLHGNLSPAVAWGSRELTKREARAIVDLLQLDRIPVFAERLLEQPVDDVSADDAALLLWLAASPVLRDVVMMQWAFDRETGDRVFDDACAYRDGVPAAELETSPLMMGEGPRPDPPRIETAILILKEVVARAPRDYRPPLLCMLAWLNWALGRSTVAGRFVEAAIEIDPCYGLAEVLLAMLDSGHLPEWAFALEGSGGGGGLDGRALW